MVAFIVTIVFLFACDIILKLGWLVLGIPQRTSITVAWDIGINIVFLVWGVIVLVRD